MKEDNTTIRKTMLDTVKNGSKAPEKPRIFDRMPKESITEKHTRIA
jgi:hypothetical protein